MTSALPGPLLAEMADRRNPESPAPVAGHRRVIP
ncbi:hypothetical protein SAMN05421543_110112 [Alicyclobacillus macrosporangiidus]|uniref:Uncharacterized protein n=1 Tax=Alicyclobacillus macrosporangiidus TaxID=392015 RepID=A0A1I7JL22_9BACL|nr:hypothetical protein SAMN05421543_110112 [Alicyclobacillus macrosporangiidus]